MNPAFEPGPPPAAGRRALPRLHAAAAWGPLLAAIVLACLAGPAVWRASPTETDLLNRFAGPSLQHPLGTDSFGRDLLARILHGGRNSLLTAGLVLVCTVSIGAVVGVSSAVVGGRIDQAIARLVDGMLALPSLILALGVVGALGPGWRSLVIALVATGWPWFARVYRSLVITERERGYVAAARALGAGPLRIAICHIGRNVFGPGLVVATTELGNAILGLAAFSFLGLGVAPPTPEWGLMVSDGRQHFQSHPWIIIAPGLAITITVVAVNLFGDALRDATDPLRARRSRGSANAANLPN
ncbi:ABC transporter permease [Tepidiforma sp.]|uniref:ABC transporter permease n=1 Tax=Tepidiforma sp. TaxID=2682230 RepID=UPI002ADDD5BC|nr:ABC transporter permease [Tepidiforma sp.]